MALKDFMGRRARIRRSPRRWSRPPPGRPACGRPHSDRTSCAQPCWDSVPSRPRSWCCPYRPRSFLLYISPRPPGSAAFPLPSEAGRRCWDSKFFRPGTRDFLQWSCAPGIFRIFKSQKPILPIFYPRFWKPQNTQLHPLKQTIWPYFSPMQSA